ncbi:MAG: class IV adenylate cyclase [Methanomassiliicoccales archaeon]|nr:class IV adenylate cyclase [Methanomassiliicoccales archaeon]
MLEIEVKSPCDDLHRVEKLLGEMGARMTGRRKQVDIYLSHPTRDFGATDEALRIRREGDAGSLTYKGPKIDKDTKTREELKIDIVDTDKLLSILHRLGFKESGRVEKLRTMYSIRGVTVCLDSVSGLGDFVESEYEGEDLDAGKEAVLSLMDELGLRGNERRSYLELLLDKKD